MLARLISGYHTGKKIRRMDWRHAQAYWQFDVTSNVWVNQKEKNVLAFTSELTNYDDWEEWVDSSTATGTIVLSKYDLRKPKCTEHEFVDTGMVRTYCKKCGITGYWREGIVIVDEK